MRITSRGKTIAFFITLCVCLVALAVFLNVSWIVYHWRSVVPLVLGIVFFSVIIAGLVVNTIFIVREVRRNEHHRVFRRGPLNDARKGSPDFHCLLLQRRIAGQGRQPAERECDT